MGFDIAISAAKIRAAILVSGPQAVKYRTFIQLIPVISAIEMYNVCNQF
jgi:hypothetical protein